MLEGLWTSELLREAENEFMTMLALGYDMFEAVTAPLCMEATLERETDVEMLDKQVNQLHRDIRRKVFEHLAIAPTKNLFLSLVLLSVVDDSERIGDLCKNIAHVLSLTRLDVGAERRRELADLQQITREAYKRALTCFRKGDAETAAELVRSYADIAKRCRSDIDEVLVKEKEYIKKDAAAFVLLIRLLQRLNAHLKNIASSVVNPYHRIGYKVKDDER